MATKRELSYGDILNMGDEIFEKYASDVFELYRKGRIKVVFWGSGFTAQSLSEDENLLMQKYSFSRSKVMTTIFEIMRLTFSIIRNRVPIEKEKIGSKALETFSKRVDTLAKTVTSDNSLLNSFYAYTLCRDLFYGGLDWEANLKVFQSPDPYIMKSQTLAIGKIRVTSYNTENDAPEPQAVAFEITKKDVENMISQLVDLKVALETLESSKVISTKA